MSTGLDEAEAVNKPFESMETVAGKPEMSVKIAPEHYKSLTF
jgi:hypothetical protein